MNRDLLGTLVLLAWVHPLHATPPVVESVVPGIVQRGTELTVTISGGRLTEPSTLLFYEPGLTCTKLTAKSENEVIATVRAAIDCHLASMRSD